MKIEIEITESDLRTAVFNLLKTRYPKEITTWFGCNPIEVKMTYRANETWRRPRYVRLLIEKNVPLCPP